jgi:hypothetical protein
MIKFLKNPTEFILNLFNLTMLKKKPSLLLMTMLDFTHESNLQQIYRQGRIDEVLLRH